MHDVLRARVMRKIESLPEVQIYQILDYIEFLESRHASAGAEKQASGLQRLAEGLEDRLRNRSFNPSNLREAFQVIAAADRALSGVAQAGRQLLDEIAGGATGGEIESESGGEPVSGEGDETEPPEGSGDEEAPGDS